MKISTPEAQGISSKALERFVDKLKEQKIPVHRYFDGQAWSYDNGSLLSAV